MTADSFIPPRMIYALDHEVYRLEEKSRKAEAIVIDCDSVFAEILLMKEMLPCALFFTILLNFCHAVLSDDCACATMAVHVRNGTGMSHAILATLPHTHCLPLKSQRKHVTGASWVNVDVHGKDGWIHEGHVTIRTCPSTLKTLTSDGPQLPGCPRIVTRAQWGARGPTFTPGNLTATPRYMFIHHGASASCFTRATCERLVRSYQIYHMDVHHWSDIGYSFLVGEDGNVYEGRGWDHIGAHTYGYNSVGLGICVIGNFTARVPNQAALSAVRKMIECGHGNGKLTPGYTLLGHRDVRKTDCPGDKLYQLIRNWSHYNTTSHTGVAT